MTIRSVKTLEDEIAELEKQSAGEPEVLEEEVEEKETPPVPKEQVPLSQDEKTWKERYGELRALHQKTAEALKAKQAPLEITEDQVKDWIASNPKAADIIKAISRAEVPANDILEIKSEIEQTRAMNAILKAHPDFEEVSDSKDFHNWANSQPDRVQALIFSDQASDVIWALNLYKEVSKPKVDTKKDAAKLIKAKTGNDTPADKSHPVYTESLVQRMSLSEYEKHEQSILAAQKAGNFVYDLSGGAR